MSNIPGSQFVIEQKRQNFVANRFAKSHGQPQKKTSLPSYILRIARVCSAFNVMSAFPTRDRAYCSACSKVIFS